MQQPVEKKVLVMPSAAPKLDRDALRAAKLASRRELGLPVSPPMSTQQALRPQGKSLRPVGKGQQKAGPGAASPAASMWKKATPKQTGSVVSTSPPVRTVSEFDTASSQSPDWTSHDEPELQSPRLQHSSQKPLRHQFVAKGISSEAASSPMTPNAIKAFQPEPSEHDNESSGSLSSPSAESVIGLQQDKDAESVFTDVDHDGLFCMEGGSSSDAPELYQLDNRPHDSTGYASPDLCDMAMKFSCQQQNFLAVLALQKAQACALQYQMLGFSKHQGIAAVNKFGDNLQSGLAWLLSASEQYLQVSEC